MYAVTSNESSSRRESVVVTGGVRHGRCVQLQGCFRVCIKANRGRASSEHVRHSAVIPSRLSYSKSHVVISHIGGEYSNVDMKMLSF